MTFEEKIKDIIQYYNLGNFLKAESIAKSLITRNAQDYQLCNIYGLILLKLNKTEGAISYFQKSIHIKSDFFEAHFNLLQLLYDLKKFYRYSLIFFLGTPLLPPLAGIIAIFILKQTLQY